MDGALTHLTVVELCDDLPGFSCGRQFAAWGAGVLTLEPPGGSPLRRREPTVLGHDGRPVSLVWEYVGAGKRCATLDLANEAERQDLVARIRQADVFITDWQPARLAAAGLDYASLAGSAPALVMVSITPFGSDGPYAGFAGSDLVVQALSGMLSLSGYPDRAPLKLPANILPYACGVSAFVGALAALYRRRAGGVGQLVEVACVEAVASLVLFLRAQYLGEPFPRRSGVGTVMLPCRDGHVICSAGVPGVWDALCLTLEIEPSSVPEALQTQDGRQDRRELLAFFNEYTRPWPARELFERLGTLHVVCGLVQSTAQLLHDSQLEARGCLESFQPTKLDRVAFPGPAGHMSETPRAAPEPIRPVVAESESGDELSRRGHEGAGSDGDPKRPPLAGVRVLDLTGAWIGPYAATLLADFGADVIKIESPHRPDVWRIYRPTNPNRLELPPGAINPRAHPRNTSFYYNSVNRNKRGLTLDLTKARGKELFLQLVAGADLVMENFTPRVMENFGLDYEALRAVRPDLIMASFSGYGATGPYRDYKATGATIEAIAGWTSLFGYPGEPPMAMGEMEADPLSGLQMAAHALVALEYRACTGRGQRIDGSMFEAAVGYIGEELMLAGLAPEAAHPRGNRDREMAPQGAFPCFGDDQWLAISVRDDRDWQALLSVAGDAIWLRDTRFQSAAGRLQHRDELEALVGRWTSTHPAHALMISLQEAGVPAGVVLKTDEVPRDAHFLARGWFRPLSHPDMGTHLYNGYSWRFSASELVWRLPPPRIGEHSTEILTGELGLTSEGYVELEREGVTASILEWPGDDAAAG